MDFEFSAIVRKQIERSVSGVHDLVVVAIYLLCILPSPSKWMMVHCFGGIPGLIDQCFCKKCVMALRFSLITNHGSGDCFE